MLRTIRVFVSVSRASRNICLSRGVIAPRVENRLPYIPIWSVLSFGESCRNSRAARYNVIKKSPYVRRLRAAPITRAF